MDKYDIDFFYELDTDDQHDVLYFARAFMRVREMHLDKSYSAGLRKSFKELEDKLEAHLIGEA